MVTYYPCLHSDNCIGMDGIFATNSMLYVLASNLIEMQSFWLPSKTSRLTSLLGSITECPFRTVLSPPVFSRPWQPFARPSEVSGGSVKVKLCLAEPVKVGALPWWFSCVPISQVTWGGGTEATGACRGCSEVNFGPDWSLQSMSQASVTSLRQVFW